MTIFKLNLNKVQETDKRQDFLKIYDYENIFDKCRLMVDFFHGVCGLRRSSGRKFDQTGFERL